MRKLEAFFALFVAIMGVCFAINFFKTDPDWGEVVYGTFVPTLPSSAMT
jgi:Mn2+/Fe2+ NRAMP family transporter